MRNRLSFSTRFQPENGVFLVVYHTGGYSLENSPAIFIRGGEPWLMDYCWRTDDHATERRLLRRILRVPGPSLMAYAKHNFRHLGVRPQYVRRVPLAPADAKGEAGRQSAARRRAEASRAARLPTGGPGGAEAPPAVAAPCASTPQRCGPQRAARAGSERLEVDAGGERSPGLRARPPPKDGRGVPQHPYRGAGARHGAQDVAAADRRPGGVGRLAPGGRRSAGGHGQPGCGLAAGLPAARRPVRTPGRTCPAHPGRPRTANGRARRGLDRGAAPPWRAAGALSPRQAPRAGAGAHARSPHAGPGPRPSAPPVAGRLGGRPCAARVRGAGDLRGLGARPGGGAPGWPTRRRGAGCRGSGPPPGETRPAQGGLGRARHGSL